MARGAGAEKAYPNLVHFNELVRGGHFAAWGQPELYASEPRGHVVLVNFWTLTCINWLRQEPYVRAWSQTYRDDGMVVIGITRRRRRRGVLVHVRLAASSHS